jgi:uncharacterized membrane protein YbaN (DUF454 family)
MADAGTRVVRGPARWFWFATGFCAVGLGSVGVIVPGLPTTVFFIIAAWCFARSSPRFEAWVLGLPKVGAMVQSHRDGLGMPRRAKAIAISMIVLFSAFGTWVLGWPIGLVVALAAVVGVLYVGFRVPTRERVLAGRPDRISARVVLLDGDDRLLLFLADFGDGNGPCWFTPGGGIDEGETPAEAAARELAEETGLVVAPSVLGEPVWTRRCRLLYEGRRILQHESYFLVRVLAHEVDTRGFDEAEASVILSHRWWSVDELRSAEGLVVWPSKVADHLEVLLARVEGDEAHWPVTLETELDRTP